MELERIYGIQKGNNQHSLRDNLVTKTQHELATQNQKATQFGNDGIVNVDNPIGSTREKVAKDLEML